MDNTFVRQTVKNGRVKFVFLALCQTKMTVLPTRVLTMEHA